MIFIIIFILWIWFYFSLPSKLFDDKYSTVVFSSDSILLGAHISADGQWRFESHKNIPSKYKTCLLAYEDKRFYHHPGIDLISLARAIGQNLRSNKIKSGASTITMQLARLSKKNPPRTVFNKLSEMILAARLELEYDKEQILALYAANAPFGGNVVGLEAASWRYFGLPPDQLSWAQSATLAVLPNSPGLIHPGANRSLLRKKRDWLLRKLYKKNVIDSTVFMLAIKEDIPPKPLPLPAIARHLVAFLKADGNSGTYITTIDEGLQAQLTSVMKYHQAILRQNEIYNMAILVIRNSDGAVMAYLGNTAEKDNKHNNYVDMIRAGRSGGSILKPLLYACAMEEGTISPYQLLSDVPVNVNGYHPQNFSGEYDGAVRVEDALKRSLNIPAVLLLKNYGIQKMIVRFRDMGFTTIDKTAEYYGLPLILGAPDVKLWELAGVYASMARTLNNFTENDSKYYNDDFCMPVVLKKNLKNNKSGYSMQAPVLGAAAIWFTFDFLTKPKRPEGEGQWQKFVSQSKIAWKTGTSYGYKDAWAIGVSKDYTVGVWVGNSNGNGRPQLVGVKAAAPVLFNVFDKLPKTSWFATPYDDMKMAVLCRHSGYIHTGLCEQSDTLALPSSAIFTQLCPYHKIMLSDTTGKMLVPSHCRDEIPVKTTKYFVLPPLQEYYYRKKHPEYKGLPNKKYHCKSHNTTNAADMQFIYPNPRTKLIIPVDFNGEKGKVVFKLAHRNPEMRVFWHVDNKFITTTKEFHNVEVFLSGGKHILTAIDENGYEISANLMVVPPK